MLHRYFFDSLAALLLLATPFLALAQTTGAVGVGTTTPDASTVLNFSRRLAAAGVGTRRYFFPTLNSLPYYTGEPCPIAEDVSRRVLCLPFYQELAPAQVQLISQLVRASMGAESAKAAVALRCVNA
jgi:hypothetical protein